MTVEMRQAIDPPGMELIDRIERGRFRFHTPEAVDPLPAATDGFPYPIDAAWAVETNRLRVDTFAYVGVLDRNGQTEATLGADSTYEFDGEVHFLDVDGPIKCYCRVIGDGTVRTGPDAVTVTFRDETRLVIGARSYHRRPAATITTPDDPTSMMRALSALSSSLKTTSPMRAWPSLRGHPPLIECGDALEVPEGLTAAAPTSVTLRVEPTYDELFAVAPLAYYLGASIEPGEETAIETAGTTVTLGRKRPLEDDVARLLKHVFLLDCVVRMAGPYKQNLRERNALEDRLPFTLADAFEAPPDARLEAYLAVPFALVEKHLPQWPVTAHLPARPESVEAIPFVLDELGVIRDTSTSDVEVAWDEAVDRNEGTATSAIRHPNGEATPAETGRTALGHHDGVWSEPRVLGESVEHAWFGDGLAIGTTKATVTAYRNRLEREPLTDGIDVLLVCNDGRMVSEHDGLEETYGSRADYPMNVDSLFGTSPDELADEIADGGYDFLHYIGHARADGLVCPGDEVLDVTTLDSVGLRAFFLNACRSYEQALALVERGAFGGIATIVDVENAPAVTVGESVARLLNHGFTLNGALECTRLIADVDGTYLVVGDGNVDVVQTDTGSSTVSHLDRRPDGSYVYWTKNFPSKTTNVGSTQQAIVADDDERYVGPGVESPSFTVSKERLETALTWNDGPIVVDGRLEWHDDLRVEHLLE